METKWNTQKLLQNLLISFADLIESGASNLIAVFDETEKLREKKTENKIKLKESVHLFETNAKFEKSIAPSYFAHWRKIGTENCYRSK